MSVVVGVRGHGSLIDHAKLPTVVGQRSTTDQQQQTLRQQQQQQQQQQHQ